MKQKILKPVTVGYRVHKRHYIKGSNSVYGKDIYGTMTKDRAEELAKKIGGYVVPVQEFK